MAQLSARGAALTALRLWRKQKRHADSVISEVLDNTKLGATDRAFAFDLFYGTLRNLILLDFWISKLRQGKLDVDLRDVLRLGLYQLFIANIPEHAAVNESVALTTRDRRGLINAVLRSAARRRDELQEIVKSESLAIRTSHPNFLVERWEVQFGKKQTVALCEWNNQIPRLFARSNGLKIDREEFHRTYPDAHSLTPQIPNFVEFRGAFPTRAIESGHCYIQDPSTRIACELLDPKPVENILDACAAPGGKTTYIAELMDNKGAIVACDQQEARISVLEENIKRLGITNTQLAKHDWTHESLPPVVRSAAPFDRILVDAPCTNTGVMRRRVDVRWRLRPDEFARMQKLQLTILRSVLPLLKENGVLVYSTCSLEPEENRDVVQHLLEEMSILRVESEQTCLPFRDGFDGAYAARLIKTA